MLQIWEPKMMPFVIFFPVNFLRFKLVKVIVRFFSLNLGLICTSVFFQKLAFFEPLRRVQFQLFEKLTRAN